MPRASTLSSVAASGSRIVEGGAEGSEAARPVAHGAGLFARLGLPRVTTATKFYGAIALALAVVYLLAAATTQFATQTAEVVGQFRSAHMEALSRSTRLAALLEQYRNIFVSTAAATDSATLDAGERSREELGRQITDLMGALGYRQSHTLSGRFQDVARQASQALALVRRQGREPASVAVQNASAALDAFRQDLLAERQQQLQATETAFDGLVAHANSLVTWVCAAAALTGLLIGPIGLFFLHRVMARLQAIGSALVRLARNDTSVDIPGLTDLDEVGQLARSVAVFKAKSIELLQKKAEMERLNVQLDAAINNMPLGLCMFDAQDRLLVCNKRFAEMYDLPGELMRPGTAHCVVWDHKARKGARQSGSDASLMIGANQPASAIIEYGGDRIISVSHQPLKGGGWVALHEDITLRRRQEEEISHLARHDPLTSLANRVLFREQLQRALMQLGHGQGFAVLCLDLDHFKSVNDTLGHPIGDILLKQVSDRLTHCVRHGDLVARLGGDEFAIIQANVSDEVQTEKLAERIVDTVSRPYEIEGHRIHIGTSIGMTLAPRDSQDADELMRNADLALYRIKSDGRNGYSFFLREMNDAVQVRRTLEIDLRKAVDQEQLELHYQPIIALESQAIVGFEALLRWQHPVRGLIEPSEFVGLAEEINLISEIGGWALQEACNHAARWPVPLKVAVNLSPLQIRRNLVETVLHALAASGLPPDRLELEVTETVLVQDSENTFSVLHQLRQLGIRIAMDDFGTGYCSLSYLRSFPFDKIKIDRAFIAGIEYVDESRAIVSTIVRLADSLGMTTVAEGIETREQLRVIANCGCDLGQGFVFSRAVPAHKVARLIKDGWQVPHDQSQDAA